MTYEPIEHVTSGGEVIDITAITDRAYGAGLRVGLIKGMVAGVVLAPALWACLSWMGA